MSKSHDSFEEKLVAASQIIKEAAKQLKESGLELNFEITITPQRLPSCITGLRTEPGEKEPPLK